MRHNSNEKSTSVERSDTVVEVISSVIDEKMLIQFYIYYKFL